MKIDLSAFTESNFYKIYLSPLIKVSFAFLGDTFPIWGSMIILNIVFLDVWKGISWPGLDSFIFDGTILVITFAFLSSAFYYSTRSLKINFFNCSSGLLLIASAIFYTRVIALRASNNENFECDNITNAASHVCFWASLLLYYIILAREKYIKHNSNVKGKRDKTQNELERKLKTVN